MYRRLHDELSFWAEQSKVRARLERKRDAASLDVRRHEDELVRQEARVARDQSVLARVEQGGWRRLFSLVGGGKARVLARLIAQIEMGQRRLSVHHQATQRARHGLHAVEGELAALGDVEQGYRRALETKARTLAASSDAQGQLVNTLIEELALARSKIRDLGETSSAGLQVHAALDVLGRCLDPPGGVGYPFALGRFTPSQAFDAVASAAHQAQQHLRAFLRGVGNLREVRGGADRLLEFADRFFERLVDSWLTAPRDERSRDAVARVQRCVDALLTQVERVRAEVELHQSSVWSRFVATVHAG